MLVRVAEKRDLRDVAELNAAVQRLHYEARPDWFVPHDAASVSTWLTSAIERDDVFIFVAEDDERVVGYALATLHRRPATPFTRPLSVLEMDQIGVQERARRAG